MWFEHVGIQENSELAMSSISILTMICCLDPIVSLFLLAVDLYSFTNPVHTVLFLVGGTVFLLHYEVCIALSMVFAALAILESVYSSRKFSQ